MSISEKLEIFLITYNRAKKLENTLNQIFAENSPVKNFDITVIDNNSTDSTREVVIKFQTLNGNLKYEKNKYNIELYDIENSKNDLEQITNEINEGKIKLNTLEIEEKGENIAVKEMRKHISAYTKSMPDSSSFRSKINTMDTAEEVRKCLKEYFAQ